MIRDAACTTRPGLGFGVGVGVGVAVDDEPPPPPQPLAIAMKRATNGIERLCQLGKVLVTWNTEKCEVVCCSSTCANDAKVQTHVAP